MITWTRKISSIIKKINKDLLFENKQNRKLHLKLVETKMNKDDTTSLLNIKCHGTSRKATKSAFLEKLTPHILKEIENGRKSPNSDPINVISSLVSTAPAKNKAKLIFDLKIKNICDGKRVTHTSRDNF